MGETVCEQSILPAKSSKNYYTIPVKTAQFFLFAPLSIVPLRHRLHE
jgi:hypothetical protein